MRRTMLRILAISAAAAGVIVAVASIPALRRRAQDLRANSEKRLRYERGRATGMRYRLGGNVPDPNVSDDILADRVRSSIGPIEKRLDIPRVHIGVTDHVVHLHGVVATPEERDQIERACSDVSGVLGTESYLHVGLGSGDTRPSEAMWHPEPSRQLRELLNAARAAGVPSTGTWLAVRAVLSTFTDRIPAPERQHVFSHLPADVIGMAATPRRVGTIRPRSVAQLIGMVQGMSGLNLEASEAVTESVLATLRELIPEEAGDVAATLPKELRELWIHAVPVA